MLCFDFVAFSNIFPALNADQRRSVAGKAKPGCAVAVFVEGGGECFLKKSTLDRVHSKGRVSCQPKKGGQ
jgi:hypothetical protein